MGADWKNLALFFIVAVPGLMILTHLVAWAVRRLKERPTATLEPSSKAGYDSLEDFRKDAEELSVGDLLERCAGRGAPRNKTLEERKRKERDEARAETEFSAYHPAGAKPGGWWRRTAGDLVVLLDLDCEQGFGRFLEGGDLGPVVLPFSTVGPALPRPDEWWINRRCPHHRGETDMEKPVRIEWNMSCLVNPSETKEWVACGCLAPVNFGKGVVRPTVVKAEIVTRGPGGVGSGPHHLGFAGSRPDQYGFPESSGMMMARKCGDCLGYGMVGFGNGVPETCRTCKGSGLTA